MDIDVESILRHKFTAEDARYVHENFEKKIEETADVAGGDVVKLATKLWGVFNDPRVPASAKITLGLALAYFIFPVDLVPDATVIFGYLDDVAVMSYAINRIATVVAVAQSGRERFRRKYLRT